ncbi:MAG: hypothetical protein R3Y59_05580 [bacterium]
MKKFFTLFMALFCALTLSSCDQEVETPTVDDPEEEVTQDESTPEDYYYALINTSSATTSNDILLFADISVDYKDANGDMQTAAVTSLPWTAKIESITAPFTMLMSITFTKKEDFTPEKDSYTVTFGYQFYSETDIALGVTKVTSASSMAIAVDKLDDYIERLNSNYAECSYEIAE